MQKAIKIVRDVLAVGIFLLMCIMLINEVISGFSYPLYNLLRVLTISVSGLSILFVLKKLL